ISSWRNHGQMVSEADRHGLRDVADPRAIGAVPETHDDRFRIAQQAGRNTGASWLHRNDLAELREAVGFRRRWSRLWGHSRPVGGPTYRSGHAVAVSRTHDGAGRSESSMAHTDTVAAAGREPARRISKTFRTGRYR